MNLNRRIYLWSDTAPYSEFSPGQAQPSIEAFCVEGSKGAVIVVPGGGYVGKAAHEGAPIALMINEAGVSAFVLDYRVKPCHHLAPLADANRAVRLVRSLGYSRVGILGFSAGGNLACNAATHYDLGDPGAADIIEKYSSRPDAFVPCYAVVSMVAYQNEGSVKNLLGENAGDRELLRYFSGELNVTRDTPPAFIWHTADDEAVPVENSLMLASRLSENHVPFEMHIFPTGRHGLGLAVGNNVVGEWTKCLQKWLILFNFGRA